MKKDTNTTGYVTVKEAEAITGISIRTIWRMVKDNTVESKLNEKGKRIILRESLEPHIKDEKKRSGDGIPGTEDGTAGSVQNASYGMPGSVSQKNGTTSGDGGASIPSAIDDQTRQASQVDNLIDLFKAQLQEKDAQIKRFQDQFEQFQQLMAMEKAEKFKLLGMKQEGKSEPMEENPPRTREYGVERTLENESWLNRFKPSSIFKQFGL